jgi:ubiquinone/menaquinone biosynthesis C-methylase UbiE
MDELTHAGDEHRDAGYVEGYDRKASFDPIPDVARLRSLGLSGESTLIDLGTGTGDFALAAARACRQVIAVDISPAMIEALRLKMARQRITNLEVVLDGFLTYEHQGPQADFVFSRNALHHLPDFWKALALKRMAGMLRPGGVLRLRDIVFSFEPEDARNVIDAWLEGAPARPEDGWTQIELEMHLREEYSTFSWLMEPMLQKAGFEIRQASYSESRVFAAYVCVKV